MKRMTVLGTGEALCRHYHNTCFTLDDGQAYFLVDGGGGNDILGSFDKMQIPWQGLHFAFLSHEHTDHILGMVWVVRYIAELINWNMYDGDFTLYTHDVAGEKLLAICRMLLKPAQAEHLGKRIRVQFVADGESVEILGSRFTFFDIHSTKAKQFGFRMDTPTGLSLVFLGDEPFAEPCACYMQPCDWLLSEAFCLYAERAHYKPETMHHSTVKETCACAARFGAKNLVILHTEDETTYGRRRALYTEEARQFYDGTVYVPDDYDIIEMEPGGC